MSLENIEFAELNSLQDNDTSIISVAGQDVGAKLSLLQIGRRPHNKLRKLAVSPP